MGSGWSPTTPHFAPSPSLRVRIYERLESLAPAGLPAFRSGDLMARFVHDVDSLQDLIVRVISPFAIAVLVGAVTVALVWLILPAAGAVILLVALVLAGDRAALAHRQACPPQRGAAGLDARRADGGRRRPRPRRARARRLRCSGATSSSARSSIDARLGRIARRGPRGPPASDRASRRCCRRWRWSAAWSSGSSAVRAGRLDVVLLAVIAIVPAGRLRAGHAGCRRRPRRSRACARRSGARATCCDAEPVVIDPVRARGRPARPGTGSQVRGLRCRYGDDGPLGARRRRPGPRARPAGGLVGPQRRGQVDARRRAVAVPPYQAGSVTLGGVELQRARAATTAAGWSAWWRRTRTCSTPRLEDNLRARATATRPRSSSRERWPAPGCSTGSTSLPDGLRHRGGRAWRPDVRRPAPAARRGPCAAGRLPGAGARRAGRAPRHGDRRRDRGRRARCRRASRRCC